MRYKFPFLSIELIMSWVLRTEQLGKRYRVGQRAPFRTVRGAMRGLSSCVLRAANPLAGRKSRSAETEAETEGKPEHADSQYHWAIRDIALEIKQGDVVGLIGRNGAGKSTLLRVLSRITEPTEGRAEIRGRVGSLLEVGTGFHPELTGRENIYLNGAILGMGREEVRRKFDAIVDFSGVGIFLDTPVKRFSSGMQVRLAFAVAAHLEPEILIIDEVLAVGDAEFQRRCLGKMGEATKSGRTVLFVSHNMASIQSLCTRGIWIDQGRIAYQGGINDTIQAYLAMTTRQESGRADLTSHQGRRSESTSILRSLGLKVDSNSGGGDGNAGPNDFRRVIATGESAEFEIGYELPPGTTADRVELRIQTLFGEPVVTLASDHSGGWSGDAELQGTGVLRCRIPELALNEGQYAVTVAIGHRAPEETLDQVDDALRFDVEFHDFFGAGAALSRSQGHYAVRSEWGRISCS